MVVPTFFQTLRTHHNWSQTNAFSISPFTSCLDFILINTASTQKPILQTVFDREAKHKNNNNNENLQSNFPTAESTDRQQNEMKTTLWTKAVSKYVKQASAETEIHMEHFWAAVVSSIALADI